MLLVGLGNPGQRYARTRHNVGFLVVDRIAQRHGVSLDRKQFGALVDKVAIGDEATVLAKPQTFMNLSGQAAASLRGFYKVEVEDIVVVHDDVDLPFGQVRVKRGGGHGGHNGLRDLQAKLGQNGFTRIRFGVSRPPSGWDTADYVLGKWTEEESAEVDELVDRAADAAELVVSEGVTAALNKVNAEARGKRAKKRVLETQNDSGAAEGASSTPGSAKSQQGEI